MGLKCLKAIAYASGAPGTDIEAFVSRIDALVTGRGESGLIEKDALRDLISSVEPKFSARYIPSDVSLDQRA